MISPSALLWSL